MLTLYVKSGCLFCAKVLATGHELGFEFDERNIADPGVLAELIERGGKHQVPFLIDGDMDVQMYESDDIVDYLRSRAGTV